jgi:hypothetical protein
MKVMAAVTSPLRAICWPFASHSGALKGNASSRLIGLVGMNEVADATVRSADCHRGADAAAPCDRHNRFPHPGRIPDRVQPSYQTAVNSSEAVRQSDEQAALTAFNNESGQQPIADLMCAMKAAAIRDFLRRIAAAKCIMINQPRSLRQPGLFLLPPQRTSNPVICITVLEGGRA